MSLCFSVSDWAAWGPGLETKEDWLNCPAFWDGLADSDQAPDVKDLPMMLRRRLSRLGRMVMRVAHDIAEKDDVVTVFSSRYGESAQTVKLLQSLSLGEPLSPANFSMSVHNGLAGLFSIVSKNKRPHTAISSGPASFCTGLMEAAALLAQDNDQRVLFVHYDEPLPEFYRGTDASPVKPMALALLLESTGKDPITLELSAPQGTQSSADSALSFLEYLLKKQPKWSWQDGRTQWNSMHVE